jgi:6-phosphogluconolactonase/glucosamine-6-phosphate isomerase/deaminase
VSLDVRLFDDAGALGAAAANDAVEAVSSAIAARDHANVMFATGNSQFAFLDALALRSDVDWSRVDGFHMDEYVGLPADHPASFRRYLQERVVGPLPPASTRSSVTCRIPRRNAIATRLFSARIRLISAASGSARTGTSRSTTPPSRTSPIPPT